MHIIPSALTAAHLAAALGRGATDPGQEAALRLLMRLPGDLWRRDDIADAAYVQVSATPPTVRVLWAILPDHPALSGGERATMRICAALAQIGADLPALDVELRQAARLALRHAAGLAPEATEAGEPR